MQKEKRKFIDPKTMTEIGTNVPTNLSVADNEALQPRK